jgi:hypothetical protein
MITRSLSRRLEQLEASLTPAIDPPVIVLVISSVATGEVIERISMRGDNDPHSRGRRTRPWQQKAYEGDHQTTAQA